jgi:hypothetical protein
MSKKKIMEAFRDRNSERIEIELASNGKYFINYSILTSPCSSGPFETYGLALSTLFNHRPGVVPLNNMCRGCRRTDCSGESCTAWTGCARKSMKAF